MIHEQAIQVITIDGPAGTGKGTIAALVAKHLEWNILDSGALYRVLAYCAMEKGIDTSNESKLETLAKQLKLEFHLDNENNVLIFNEGIDISKKIRSEDCGQNASKVAAFSKVRESLLELQRRFAKIPGLVTDGRDMGTIVFPNACLKVYLDASVEERAKRRYLQLKKNKNDVSLAKVVKELQERDKRDMEREYSPLKPAKDAVIIDTTGQNITQVFNYVLNLIKQHCNI